MGARQARGEVGRIEGEARAGGRPVSQEDTMTVLKPALFAAALVPAAAGDMLIDRVERATQPTPEQRPNFDKLKEAAGKAHEIMRGACPAERAVTPTGRLANAEKRLAAMLDAVRTVRPAMDAYYGSL